MAEHAALAASFEAHRTHLHGVAYRMLGSLSEAEDAVQEEWMRFNRIDRPRRKPGRLVDHRRLARVSGHTALAEVTARRSNWRAGHRAEGRAGGRRRSRRRSGAR